MKSEVVVMFNNDWQVIGVIEDSPSGLQLSSVGLGVPPEAQWVMNQLAERDPQLQQPVKDEAGCVIGFQTVTKGEPRYMEAVRDEFRRVSLRTHILDASLVSILKKISDATFDASIRSQVVPEVIGLPTEQAMAALEAVENI